MAEDQDKKEPVDSIDDYSALVNYLKDIYGRIFITYRTHGVYADSLFRRSSLIKDFQIGLSALSAGGILWVLLGQELVGSIFGSIAATLVFGLSAYSKKADLDSIANDHREAARKIWVVREKYASLLVDAHSHKLSYQEICLRRDKLIEEQNVVYSALPSTDENSYIKTQKLLEYENPADLANRLLGL